MLRWVLVCELYYDRPSIRHIQLYSKTMEYILYLQLSTSTHFPRSFNCKGRTSDEDVTIYDPAGMALLDIAAAKVALDLANGKNLGAVVEL